MKILKTTNPNGYIRNIEIESSPSWTHRRKTKFTQLIYISPFSNCQNFSISNFNSLITHAETNENLRQIVDDIFKVGMKNSMVIDVNENYRKQIVETFKDRIVLNKPYKSTNDSKMRMFIISRNPLKK